LTQRRLPGKKTECSLDEDPTESQLTAFVNCKCTGKDVEFGGAKLDPSKPDEVAACKMFWYVNQGIETEGARKGKTNIWISKAELSDYFATSNIAISHSQRDHTWTEIQTFGGDCGAACDGFDENERISPCEFKRWFINDVAKSWPCMYSASGPTGADKSSDSSSGGVVVAGAVLGVVGVVAGVALVAMRRSDASTEDKEMRIMLSEDDCEL
jgi:hypothetical protein